MKFLSGLSQRVKKLHKLSKAAMVIGMTLMTCFYIIALVALIAAPYTSDYFYTINLHRGALEAAPACLAVGVCAGLLGDLMLRRSGDGDSSDSQ